jgi:hypothetical protein
MADREELKFLDELLQYLNGDRAVTVTIRVLSGEAYVVRPGDQVFVGKSVVSIVMRDGRHVFFPVYSLCDVEVSEFRRKSKSI